MWNVEIDGTEAVCEFCGKKFIRNTKFQKYCTKQCTTRAMCAKRKEERAEANRKRAGDTSLARIAREAREYGMTYGKYVQYLEEQKKRTGGKENV